MSFAVRIPEFPAIFFLMDLPDDTEGMEIEEGAWVEVPMNVAEWPIGARQPETILCQSRRDRKHYKLYKYRMEADDEEWELTGQNFGGTFSKAKWEAFASRLGAVRSLQAIPETEVIEH